MRITMGEEGEDGRESLEECGGVGGADYEEFHPDLEAEDDEKPLASLKKKKKRGRPPLEDEDWQAKVLTYGLLRFN